MKKGQINDSSWDLIIKPESRLFDLKLQAVWKYRDLLLMFVKRDFIAFYKQTVLGPVWFFIQPLFTTAIYVFVFGKLANLSTDTIPQPLFYLSGITAWTYFQDCLIKTSTVFKDNVHIFGKVYFPRLVLPFSIVVSNLVRFGIQLTLLVFAITYFAFQGVNFAPSLYLLLFPVLVALMAVQGLGLGMLISALTTKYRDLALLVSFGVQLLMYSTTVVYPLSSIDGIAKKIIAANPMTYIIEGIRLGLFGQGTFDLDKFLYTLLITVLIFIIGLVTFNKVERNFVDTI